MNIRSCPFCTLAGSKFANAEVLEYTPGGFAVKCHNCQCNGPMRNDRDSAICEWGMLHKVAWLRLHGGRLDWFDVWMMPLVAFVFGLLFGLVLRVR